MGFRSIFQLLIAFNFIQRREKNPKIQKSEKDRKNNKTKKKANKLIEKYNLLIPLK
jgi:hypothetical protein